MTIVEAVVTCGVEHNTQLMDEMLMQCLANNIFDDGFDSCLDINFKELDDHFKANSDLMVTQSQIRIRLGTFKNIKALVQWMRDKLVCLGCYPSSARFPVELVEDLVRPYMTHQKFINNSKTLAEDAKPDSSKRVLPNGKPDPNIHELFEVNSSRM